MIHWIAVAFLVFCFVGLVKIFKLVEKSQQVIFISRQSFSVIRSDGLDDREKEVTLQRYARNLFGLFFVLLSGGAVAVLLPFGLLWIADFFGFISLESVIDATLSPAFLIISSVSALIILYIIKRSPTENSNYSFIDRLLHRVAFNTYMAQIPIANIESYIYAGRLGASASERPVFITALPRTGTTLLLECFAQLPEFASHSYRDMPFVLTPCLWRRFSSNFRAASESRERAHGDGMLISVNSPEALDDVVWKTFWREHYLSDRIIPWKNEENEEFQEFFRNHMRKIAFLRQEIEKDAPQARYLSKNNLNIARIRVLHHYFPGSVIIVPFREPLHHAASLLKQHMNFLRIHNDDPFASEYMRAIGHYDFGKNLCPVDFDGWYDTRVSKDTEDLTFWVEYWLASYRHLLMECGDIVHFFSYQDFCENPGHGLRMLAKATGIRDTDRLLLNAGKISRARKWEVDAGAVPLSLLDETNEIYFELKRVAINCFI